MRRPLLIAVCFVSIAAVCSTGICALFIPDGVGVGQEYRLVVLIADIEGTSGTASTYDNFIDTTVAGTNLDLDAHNSTYGTSYEWQAIVSTTTGDRVVNTMGMFSTNDGVDVYNMNSDVVATDSASMLSGLSNAIRYQADGSDAGLVLVWTGSTPSGAADTGLTLGDASGVSRVGFSDSLSTNWLSSSSTLSQSTKTYVYAISDVITAVPEPTSIAIWLGFGVAGVITWRRRRRS